MFGQCNRYKGWADKQRFRCCGACHLGFVILIIKSNFDIWNSCFLSLIDYIEEIHPLLFWLQHAQHSFSDRFRQFHGQTSALLWFGGGVQWLPSAMYPHHWSASTYVCHWPVKDHFFDYLPDRPCTLMGGDNSESGRSRHPDFVQLPSPFPGSIQWLAGGFFHRGATVSTATGLDAYSSILSQVQNPGSCQRLPAAGMSRPSWQLNRWALFFPLFQFKISYRPGPRNVKGVVDCFFSRLDCVYGVQSNMCSCLFFCKTHYFSHNLPLFHTSLSLLWQTPRFISWFYEAPPSEIRDGLRLVSWLSVLWFALAAASGWNEPSLLTAFRQGLNSHLCLHLAAYDDTYGLEKFIQLAIRCSNCIQSCSTDSSLAIATPPIRQPETSDPPEPMQTDYNRLSPAERRRRLSNGLCLYCVASGHRILECPLRPPRALVSTIRPPITKMNPLSTCAQLTAGNFVVSVTTLLDSGSAGNFIAGDLCWQLRLPTSITETAYEVQSIQASPSLDVTSDTV